MPNGSLGLNRNQSGVTQEVLDETARRLTSNAAGAATMSRAAAGGSIATIPEVSRLDKHKVRCLRYY